VVAAGHHLNWLVDAVCGATQKLALSKPSAIAASKLFSVFWNGFSINCTNVQQFAQKS
jgi:hypothetical protein